MYIIGSREIIIGTVHQVTVWNFNVNFIRQDGNKIEDKSIGYNKVYPETS